MVLLALPLAAGGLIGYGVGGLNGAGAGVVAAMVLFVAVAAWREGRRTG